MIRVAPSTVKYAAAWVKDHHRHSGAPQGGLFAARLVNADGQTVGVGIAGRPVARMLQDGNTVEITRVCTAGDKNACSMLYGALCRAAKALGYTRAITYTLVREPGTSLLAAGFAPLAKVKAGDWDTPARRRSTAKRDAGPKFRWERTL